MPFIIPANTLAAGGFNVDNSVRFNSGDSAYMHKTPNSAGSLTAWTLSMWVKRSKLGAVQFLASAIEDGDNYTAIKFEGDDILSWQEYVGGSRVVAKRTNAKFRDVSAWMHIVIYQKPNDQTIYVNGVEITSWRTDTSGNASSTWNDAIAHNIGRSADGSYFGGYMAEVCFVNNASLAPTSFGEFDEDSGIWKPIDVSGLTFGTNGFYLDFEASGNLGNDANGGTDLTEVNLAATDQSTDTCTNNFCTINSLDNLYAAATLAEGNLKVTCSAGNTSFITSTFGLTKGKWYWEAKLTTVGGEEAIGITDIVSTATDNYAGQTANSYSFKGNNGNIRNADENASYGSAYGASVIGVYMDLDNNKLYFAINGTIQASGAGFDITAAASTTNGFYFPMVGDVDSDSPVWEVNFGNPVSALSSAVSDANGFGSFEYSPSDGGSASFDSAVKSFLAICTKNLAESG